MNEKEWELFSDLLSKIVNMPMPATDKAQLVRDHVSETDLGEFVCWFPEAGE